MASINNHLIEWFKNIEELQPNMAKYHEERLIYDHYRNKMEELSYEKQMFVQKGTLETPKFTQLYTRNEEKYEKALQNYQQILKIILDKMNHIMDNRFLMINGSLEEYLNLTSDLFSNCVSLIKQNKDLFKSFKETNSLELNVQQPKRNSVRLNQMTEDPFYNAEKRQSIQSTTMKRSSIQLEELYFRRKKSEEFSQQNINRINPFSEENVNQNDAFADYDFNQFSFLSQDLKHKNNIEQKSQENNDKQEENNQFGNEKMKQFSKSQLIEQSKFDNPRNSNMYKSLQVQPSQQSKKILQKTPFDDDEYSTPFDDNNQTCLQTPFDDKIKTPFDDNYEQFYTSPPRKSTHQSNIIRSPEENKQQKNPFL